MRGFELDLRSHARVASFLPATGTNAPTVARFESGKLIFRTRCDEVVPSQQGELEKVRRHDRTHGMNSNVTVSGMTKPIPKKSRQR